MQSLAAADALAEPIGRIGSWFYFAPSTAARGEELGLDVISFYALGRGGVLGDPTPQQVEDVFHFFKTGVIAAMYAKGLAVQPPSVGVPAHLAAADAFALATFGAVSVTVLDDFTAATLALADTLPISRWPLYDGYRSLGLPGGNGADAYRSAIWLRELRGGVHTDAVVEANLSPVVACYLDNDGRYFAMHGFTDADVPVVDDSHREVREAVERDTSERMAALLGGIDEEQREALVAGALAMKPALKAPVMVD